MKKILLMAGILALSTLVMGTERKAAEGKVEVRAKVLQQLELKTEPVDFGILVPGEKGKTSIKSGKINIKGDSGQLVQVQIKDNKSEGYEKVEDFKTHYEVELQTNGGQAKNEKMISDLTIMAQGNGEENAISNGYMGLDSKGNLEINVEGTVSAAEDQKSGDYNGVLYVRAMYR